MLSVAYGPHAAFMALRPKANFHASPVAIMTLLAKHRLHQSKNTGFSSLKNILYPNDNDTITALMVQDFEVFVKI